MTEWQETRFSKKPEQIIDIGCELLLEVKDIEFVSDEEGWSALTREITKSELTLLNQISELREALKKVTNL